MHRDYRDRRHPVGMIHEQVGVIIVQGPASHPPHVVFEERLHADRRARIQNREIKADFVQPLVQQIGKPRSREIESIRGRKSEEGRTLDPGFPALAQTQPVPVHASKRLTRGCGKIGHRLLASGFDDVFPQDWTVFGEMSVGVNHRMVEARSNFGGLQCS
jgi:hypothetical protein